MLARPRVIRPVSFLSGLAAGFAVTAAWGCSGGAYSFVPPADVTPKVNDMTTDAGDMADDAPSAAIINDASTADKGNIVTARDVGPRDVTSLPVDGPPPDAIPALIPTTGLLLWLRADVDVTENGGQVSQWRDRSGNGNDARQMDQAHRPAIDSHWHDGRPAIVFDGSSTYLELPSSFNDFAAGLSVFVVGDVANGSNCPSFLNFSNGGENEDISFHMESNDTFTYEVANEYATASMNSVQEHRPFLLAAVQRPSQEVGLFSAGMPVGQGSVALADQVHRSINDLGRSSYNDCDILNGHLAEIILYQRAVDNAERTSIENYLRTKWTL